MASRAAEAQPKHPSIHTYGVGSSPDVLHGAERRQQGRRVGSVAVQAIPISWLHGSGWISRPGAGLLHANPWSIKASRKFRPLPVLVSRASVSLGSAPSVHIPLLPCCSHRAPIQNQVIAQVLIWCRMQPDEHHFGAWGQHVTISTHSISNTQQGSQC